MKHNRSAYVNRGCRCDACRADHAARAAEFRRRPRDPASLTHGTVSTYTNYACRCQECRAANTAACRNRAARKRAAANSAA